MKVVFWGAGEQLKLFLLFMEYHRNCFKDDYLYIVDSNLKKAGMMIGGLEIKSSNMLMEEAPDCIVVTPLNSQPIYDTILRMEIKCKIMSLEEYKEKMIIEFQYKKLPFMNLKKGKKLNLLENPLVIYTAVSKHYDHLRNPQFIIPNAKYICFTNDDSLKSEIWDIRYVDFSKNPREDIREYKILPHKFLAEYTTSIWIDANMCIIGDFREYIKQYGKNSNLLLFPHPKRMCLYEEAAACIGAHKESTSKVINQILKYKLEGYPFDNGLYCGGLIVRNHNDIEIIKCMEMWWEEVKYESKRDQISLPYVLWKNHINFDLSNENIYDNRWIKILPHS